MTRTYNINLGGRLFVIDDEAYTLLLDYLDTLRNIFAPRGEAEVAEDIEYRVSELLAQRLETSASPSITLSMASEVIAQIGRPEELIEEETVEMVDNHGNTTEKIVERETVVPPPFPYPEIKKKFFRDPDNKIVGGVCSGLAAYLGIDVTFIRIAVIALCFFSLATVGIVYLVLCIVVPEARTPLQKMEMNGETPTIENIGRNVSAAFNSAMTTVNNNRGTLRSILSFIGKCFISLFLLIAIPVGIATAIGALACLFMLLMIGLSYLIPQLQTSDIWQNSWMMVHGSLPKLLGAFFSCLAVAIPSISLVVGTYRSLRKQKVASVSSVVWWTVIWVICMFLSALFLQIAGM